MVGTALLEKVDGLWARFREEASSYEESHSFFLLFSTSSMPIFWGRPHIEVKSALTFVSIILRHCTVFDLVPGPTIFDVIMSTNGGNRGSRETNQSSYRPMQLPGFERRRIGAGLVAYDRIDRIQPLPTESDIETSSEHHYKLLSDFSYFGTLAIVLSSLWDGLIHATNLQTVFIEVQVVLGLLFMLEIWAGHYCFLINERFNGIVFTSQGTINLCITILAASFNAKGLEQHETGKPLGLLYSLLLYLQLDASIEALKRPNLANRKSSVAFFTLWCVRAGLGVASSFLNKAFKGYFYCNYFAGDCGPWGVHFMQELESVF
ncbi:hypothetical protein CPB84DRAFT_1827009 [Gymnopilus junonius]|uniref:Uncharacterized protein n=1 Tax=Gymnopilus junonius TaxID=109634 RepID=A0A9P5NI82_GYMJU|nr:hypothetical protein CPB84DRAFT_1827009 [Gymnopilus junonius]